MKQARLMHEARRISKNKESRDTKAILRRSKKFYQPTFHLMRHKVASIHQAFSAFLQIICVLLCQGQTMQHSNGKQSSPDPTENNIKKKVNILSRLANVNRNKKLTIITLIVKASENKVH